MPQDLHIDGDALPKVDELISAGAIFFVNHSGGKDSQAMLIEVLRLVPPSQIVLVHADLGEVEWDGLVDHIKRNSQALPLIIARPRRGLLQMIEERGMFPSPKQRQCTSDLKRGPIEREIRRHGARIVVNCMGLRAEESPNRKSKPAFARNSRNSKAGRQWFDWLPIKDWSAERVFGEIDAAGQKAHWAYAAGMTRLSCCFCIMAAKKDLSTAARLKPDLYRRYVELEKSLGVSMVMPGKNKPPRYLEEITGVPAHHSEGGH